ASAKVIKAARQHEGRAFVAYAYFRKTRLDVPDVRSEFRGNERRGGEEQFVVFAAREHELARIAAQSRGVLGEARELWNAVDAQLRARVRGFAEVAEVLGEAVADIDACSRLAEKRRAQVEARARREKARPLRLEALGAGAQGQETERGPA